MIYIFEDDERDVIPKLFLEAYNSADSSNIIYTRGNGNIYKPGLKKRRQ